MARLDGTLRELTVYRMRRATSDVLSVVKDALEPFGLRRQTFSALSVICDHPGIRQSQLADTLAIERPNLVQVIGDLENRGLLMREQVPEDRRMYSLHVTNAGAITYRQAMRTLRKVDKTLTAGLTSDEVAALNRALHLIELNAAGETADGSQLSRS